MERSSYSDQKSHANFQPKSIQPAIEPNQFGQPAQHSGSTNDLGSNRLGKARIWATDRFQAAQNFVTSLGNTIASDRVLPALKETTSSHQPLVGVIDSGFGANEHGRKIVEAIKKENPQAQIWKGGGVGIGGWSKSLVKFVDIAKASGHSRAVANLSFDLTEVHLDGRTSNRSQLTAEEQSALAYARDHNVLIVASSGNQGGAMSALGQASQPSDNLIVVGAANGSDRASYSSYGRGLDLVAEVGAAGTSLAAAKVTGTIAQMWSNNPGLSDRQINQALTATSTDLNKLGWDAETGAGLLNATSAIGLAKHTVPEPSLFSNASLVQQASNLAQASSFRGRAWTSTDGAIASERSNWDWSEIAHGALDVAGFIPVAGAVADVANAGLYAAEGDYANAALSAAAAVPGIGDAAAAVKLVNRGVEAVQIANRATDTTQNIAARAIPSPPLPSRPQSPIAPESTPPGRSRQPELERPSATSDRQQSTPERSGSSEAAPRSGGGVTRAVATAVAPVAPYVAPLVSEESPRPNPLGSNPSSTQPYPDSTRTPLPPSGEQPNPTPGQVIVQPGATLWEIAQEHLGRGDRWTDLLEADGTPFTEQEANRLPIGTVVYLPTPAPSPSSRPEAPAPNTPISPSPIPTQLPSEQPNSAPGQITMRQGDTLWEIAQEQLGRGDRWTDLLKPDGNPFTEQEANRLPIGTIVHLPTVAPLSPAPSQAPMPPPNAPTPTQHL
jgi:LysM repeat protein